MREIVVHKRIGAQFRNNVKENTNVFLGGEETTFPFSIGAERYVLTHTSNTRSPASGIAGYRRQYLDGADAKGPNKFT